ncbi:RNA polymerase sigma factor [Peribacillus huizhouensis]|uniref:RNA polymerase sigma-70 factor (ECF subfamily) n=1 Tax=Peribacillus huizhouensis TaxID=1501239 RepID=A0ABR6CWP6_9BACI|nr:sigma-70 family RNA polymerase sigma factor [Peribacillus huizhouensis]MBA9029449.1 RNA polymerase sigma-70 factor (ECF subfamily) [Peribacillus huizhouensis]
MKNGAIEDFLIDEAKLVYKYLLKMGASKEDAEDILQDTLYRTIKNIDSIHEDKVRAWLFKVAINNYYNLYSRKKTMVHLTSEQLEMIKPSSNSAEEIYLTEQNKKELMSALNELKPAYKNLLILKYYMDLSYKEIASILETSEQNIKVYLYRARNTFKHIWEGNHDEQ